MNFRTDFTYPDGTRESLLDIGVTALPKGWVFISSRKDYNDPNYRAIAGHYSPALAREVAAAILAAADEAEGIEPALEVVPFPELVVGRRYIVTDLMRLDHGMADDFAESYLTLGETVRLIRNKPDSDGELYVERQDGSCEYVAPEGLTPVSDEDRTCLPPVEELPLGYVMQVAQYITDNNPAA